MPVTDTNEHITTQLKGHTLVISFNRANKLNSLTSSMYHDITTALEKASNNGEVNVVIIRGSEECFTAGNDISDFVTDTDFANSNHPIPTFLHTIASFDKPLIAAVAGHAIGVGTTMLMHCDLVYASPNSQFRLPFTNLGLCPEAGSSLLLPQLVGYHKASELLLLGESFGAEQAVNFGLVNRVIETDKLFSHTLDVANKLSKKSLPALRTTKLLLKKSNKDLLTNTINFELKHFMMLLSSPEAKQQFNKFLDKAN